jgi:tetrahydromethanopterin S-methyltransferase subunit B
MLSPADRIVEATMPHTLRPKRGNREKVIAAALEFLIEEYGYDAEFGMIGTIRNDVIDVKDIRNLIDELKSTVTLEELAQDPTNPPVDAL